MPRTSRSLSLCPVLTVRPLSLTSFLSCMHSLILALAVFSALTTSPNGALLCAIPFSTSYASSQPVLAAAPLGRRDDLPHKLATRLAIGIARQGDVGDLVGRVRGLGDAGASHTCSRSLHASLKSKD